MNSGSFGPSGYADLQRDARLLALLGGGSYVPGCYLDFSIADSALTVRLLAANGQPPGPSNPIIAAFHDAAAAVAKPVIRRIAQPLRLVIPSTATMGFSSATAGAFWIVLFDDVTTRAQRLGVINCVSGNSIYSLSGWPIASSTATPASGAQTFYTDVAVASMPYVILGRASWESGLSIAGTWDALPSRVRMYSPGMHLPGSTVRTTEATPYTTNESLTTSFPSDDTSPTSSSGTQILTASTAMSSATNKMRCAFEGFGTPASNYGVVGLYRGTTCIDTLASGTSANKTNFGFSYTDSPLSTASLTYSIRVGPQSGGTNVRMNGDGSTRLFGGTASCTLRLEEIMT